MARSLRPDIHAAIETAAGAAIMVFPFVVGLGTAATAVAVAIGALLVGLALSIYGAPRAVPLSAHAGFDYALAGAAILSGVVLGIAGEALATVFLVGVGLALMALTAATRFSAHAGAG